MNRITKKLLKITAFIGGGIFVLLVVFHFWFIHHAEQLIEDMVANGSNGRLKLEIRKFKFNWFSNKMELRNAVFYTTDTATAPIGYRFSVKNIRLQVKAIFPVIFEKRMLFDSLLLAEPDITVTRLRAGRDQLQSSDTSLSLTQEMGRVYNSIQDALRVLEVTRFQIDNGRFTLENKIKETEKPVSVNNIYFHLDNLEVDTSTESTKNKILFSENVVLRTHDQNIIFPDRRHRLSFRNFHINVQERIAEFDSCTIQATKGDSANTSFTIFFDKLKLINVEFDTLYHNEVIKADSVFCINPRFQLDADVKKIINPAKKPPTLNELIQQMMGDMYLSYVSVQNGSFNINTAKEGSPNSFTSDHNSFELQGFRIQKNAAKPLAVDKFVMALHNYENFLRDSAYAIKFDSILINNDRISLSNFAYRELENNRTMNNLVMPQFELRGLSWDNLVFDRNLKAKNVTLYHPVINYNFAASRNKKTNIFEVLKEIGNNFKLNNLDIVNGEINFLFKNNAKLRLENADISILGKELVDSRKFNHIRKSVTSLHFKKGYFQSRDLSIDLADAQFTGTNNRLKAAEVKLKSKNNIDVTAGNVQIESMILDDDLQDITINGIYWETANIQLNSSGTEDSTSTGSFVFNHISGNNTNFKFNNRQKNIVAFLRTISADEITFIKGKLKLAAFAAGGNNFQMIDNTSLITMSGFDFADHRSSSFSGLAYKKSSPTDFIDIKIPSLTLLPDVNALLNGKIYLDELNIVQPVARIELYKNTGAKQNAVLPDAVIGKLIVQQPLVYFLNVTEEGNSLIEWNKENNDNYLEADNLKVTHHSPTNISADELHFSLSNFFYNNTEGRTFDAGEGRLTAGISNFKMQQTEIGGWDWQGKLNNLDAENLVIDSIGKRDGTLAIASARINDLAVSSSLLLNFRDLIRQNSTFNLENVTGSYYDNRDQFNWYNTGYNRKTKFLTADSFAYRPSSEEDAFAAAHPYRVDYTRIKTGAISIGPVDINRYINDTILDAGVIKVGDIYFTDFRDQRPPIQPGLNRPLPVMSVKQIGIPFTADTLKVINADVEYEEINEKTLMPGKIFVNNLNADFINVRNYNIPSNDSLTIYAHAYINDSLSTKLFVKQSYADKDGGFRMQLQISPADILVLNPTLKPLALAELQSGKLDTLTLQVTGNDDFAYGQIKMLYKDFKVTLYKMKNGKLVASGFLNFVGNLIIKNKNTGKLAEVYFERLKNRSAVNYLLKITLNGVNNTIGLKKNKKQIRQNKKKIRKILKHPEKFKN